MIVTVPREPTRAHRSSAKPKWAFAAVATLAVGGTLAAVGFTSGGYTCTKQRRTMLTLNAIKQSIRVYSEDNAGNPKSLEALMPLYIDPNFALKDGWMRDFDYEPTPADPKHPYALRSAGSDGVLNSADDIDIWTIDQ